MENKTIEALKADKKRLEQTMLDLLNAFTTKHGIDPEGVSVSFTQLGTLCWSEGRFAPSKNAVIEISVNL